MEFTSQTERQIFESRLLPDGTYSFRVISAKDKISKSAAKREMIELSLRVSNDAGLWRNVTDYLFPALPLKLRRAAQACDILEKYQTGHLEANDFIGRNGRLMLGIEPGKNGYADKNIVTDYIVGGVILASKIDLPAIKREASNKVELALQRLRKG